MQWQPEDLKIYGKPARRKACFAAGATLVAALACDAAAYLARPASTSLDSRWYSLQELGIESVSAELDQALSARVAAQTLPGEAPDMRDVDLRDPVRAAVRYEILRNTEAWESGIESRRDRVGYPSIVRNSHGSAPDGSYYLYYSIHDPYAGIGAATSRLPTGPFEKLGQRDWWRPDSRILRAPLRPRRTSHFSSPVVIWNPAEQLWFMYFHFYSNEWEQGRGHQRTALATSKDLSDHSWSISRGDDGGILAVLPTTGWRWMNSQSTYHCIQRLPTGLWVAFLRGTGGEYNSAGEWLQDTAKLGFAVSRDGRHWALASATPVLQPGGSHGGKQGVYRPMLFALGTGGLLVGWAESDYYDETPELRFGLTRDLIVIEPMPISLGIQPIEDGPATVRREGGTLFVAQGAHMTALSLRLISERGDHPTRSIR